MKNKTAHLLLYLTIFSVVTNGQITKGVWMFGGNGSIISSSTTNMGIEYKYTSINLKPKTGYFIANNFAAGLMLEYAYSKSAIGAPVITSNHYFGIGPFTRYYFLKPDKRVNILTEINAGYTGRFNPNEGTIQYSFLAGATVFLNSSVAVEILTGYQKDASAGTENKTSSNILLTNLGLQVYLERNRE